MACEGRRFVVYVSTIPTRPVQHTNGSTVKIAQGGFSSKKKSKGFAIPLVCSIFATQSFDIRRWTIST